MTREEAIGILLTADFPKYYTIKEVKQVLNMAIQALSTESKWISVSERLPEYGEAVLTVDSDDEYEINHIIDEELDEWFYDGVVAWMPLPEPYKAES